mmetsp:Transcript_8178/g.15391  ORF Transcript_8178/g.15391 Transcript_8178/m.15391 type:complete len:265 (-) Transcript_8178:199-993(-)
MINNRQTQFNSRNTTTQENLGGLQSTSRPIIKDDFVTRWRHHILLGLLLETSDAIRIGMASAISPVMLTRWFVVISGILIGGNGLFIVEWLSIKLSEYIHVLFVYILAIALILIGPDLFPPLTPMNGCESIYKRILYTVALFILEKCKHNLPIIHLWSFEKCLFTISGLWHLDSADYDFRQTQRETLRILSESSDSLGRSGDMSSDDILQSVAHVLLSYYFEAGAGIGMLWASMNVYSCSVFFWALVIYGSVNGVIYGMYMFGR